MRIRGYFTFLFLGIALIICGTSVVSLIFFEVQLDRVTKRAAAVFSETIYKSVEMKTLPMLEKLSSELPGAPEDRQREILSAAISPYIQQIPPSAAVAVFSLPSVKMYYQNREIDAHMLQLMTDRARNGNTHIISNESRWLVYAKRIHGSDLWYSEAANLEPLGPMFLPLLTFHRYVGIGIIGVMLFLVLTTLIFTRTVMNRAVALENEKMKKASELAQTNLLLNVEVEIRRTIEQELKEANLELSRLSSTDQLTGIANRRMLDQTIEREWPRHLRDQQPISLLICDVDFFKKYNDTYGHQKGDDALKKVAAVLHRACRRPADLAARFGGEEFCVVLPETDTEGAKVLAHNIQKMIEKENIEHTASQTADHLTLSIGIATMVPSIADKRDSLLHEADLALYAAKERGRNRIEHR